MTKQMTKQVTRSFVVKKRRWQRSAAGAGIATLYSTSKP